MKVDSPDRPQPVPEKVAAQPQNRGGRFSKVFNEYLCHHDARVNRMSGIARIGKDSAVDNSRLVRLGTITDKVPTISNLLIQHPAYRKDTWNIIQSEKNRAKPYTAIRPGTDIYLNSETLELSWNADVTTARSGAEKIPGDMPEKADRFIALGTISQDTPTVSRLLRQHSDYRQSAYRIIHSAVNRDKPYTRMAEGTRVYLNPKTLEIVWDNESFQQDAVVIAQNPEPSAAEVHRQIPQAPDPFSENLVKSVAHFVGSPYEQIDCFELLVRGLNKMGINYTGRGGLYDQLVKMAVARGLPENAYLNGEGLIKASGTQVYFKSMPRIDDAAAQAEKIYKEMEPFLNKGFVLSFSTQTRGHTGIVSQKDQLWTYINSGRMDHNLGGTRDPKGVGEEVLADEIKNWVTMAAKSKQPLKITLGRLDAQKLLGIET